jgi:hypothetical protein
MEQLRAMGWRLSTARVDGVGHHLPTTPKRGGLPSVYVRIYTLLGEKEPWFFAKLEEGKSGWWSCIIRWRAPGRDAPLSNFMEKTALEAAMEAEKHLKQYEVQTRLGWVP